MEYDGSLYAGWQSQQHGMTVQQVLEEAVRAFSGEGARLHVAGRTDSGVHALGQVAHFDLEKESSAKTIRDAINAKLREKKHGGVSVVAAEPVSGDFHARFGAQNRVYLYRILAARAAPPALLEKRVWHMREGLDVAAMNAGAQYLLGSHDFSSFRAAGCQANSPLRSIRLVEVAEDAECAYGAGQAVSIRVEAKSFLYHQVRNIVGSLVPVGTGKWPPQKIEEILAACDRTKAAATAPAHGLYFMRVDY